MEKNLSRVVEKLVKASAANIECIVLYGSAATGEFQPGRSDLNLLCVLRLINEAELKKLQPAAKWWRRKGNSALLFFTQEELARAADIFAIELIEIKQNRRLLFGSDVFASLDVPMTLHRQQVERELRHNLTRLRQGYVAAAGNRRGVEKLILKSFATFGLLFRHALIALNEAAPAGRDEAAKQLSALLRIDGTALAQISAASRDRNALKRLDLEALFGEYLDAITEIVNELDRRFDRLTEPA